MISNYEFAPKISCLLVTRDGRIDFFKRSFKCFCDQTYRNKELIVVNEGPSSYQYEIRNIVKDRTDVKLVFLDGQYSLGTLRNISISMSSGEVFVQWDDDDFCTPERILTQFKYLRRNPSAKVCYLSDQLHYYFDTNQLYWDDWTLTSGGFLKYSLIPGTIMAWKSRFSYRYPRSGNNCKLGEDSVLANKLCSNPKHVALLKGFGYMHIYSYHGKNVWDSVHHSNISKVKSVSKDVIESNLNFISKTIDYMKFEGEISVMSNNEEVFKYRSKND